MKKIVFGVIIVLVGIFLIANNLGYIPAYVYDLVISWQALLIAIGIPLLFDRHSPHHDNIIGGVILIFIGGIFMLGNVLDMPIKSFILPVVLVFIGLLFIIRPKNKGWHHHKNDCFAQGHHDDHTFKETPIEKGGVVHRDYVFTGAKEKWTYGALRNVEITSVFSGVELDFTQAELASDVKVAVRIKVEAVFGGVILYVPEDWNIIIQKECVFGGFVDSRPAQVVAAANKDKLVILEVEAVFGGGEIKCYE
ncbi:hypothetical protein AGMMS49982_22470 [Bacteroidia bacterium]|nr:hypothetical protein AGMMS49982_22470 [Bacteroidia bacterium]